jgi:putative ABC transport system permease protein
LPEYFRTARIPLLKGRDFTTHDNQDSPKVAMSTEPWLTVLGPIRTASVLHITRTTRKWIIVVGVVGDVLEYGLDQTATAAEAYFPEFQGQESGMIVLIRTAANPIGQLSALQGAVRDLDSQIPVDDPRELAEVVTQSSSQQRFLALLLGLFAGLALILAAVGIYSVIAYSVAQRTHEIGIRMALGAGWPDMVGMLLREGLGVALGGVIAGLAGAWGLTRFLASQLYGVHPTDPATFIAVPLLLMLVAVLACYVPARRAAKVDPMIALRYE